MKSFTTCLLLMAALANGRRHKRNDLRNLEDEEYDLDITKVVGRVGKPSGLEACDDPVDQEEKFIKWATIFG